MTEMYDSLAAQMTYSAADAPGNPDMGVADAFSVGYNSVYSESLYGSGVMISSQYAENRRTALEFGLDMPDIRSNDGKPVDPEEFSKYFSGEDANVSADSVSKYESYIEELRKKNPNVRVKSLSEIWSSTQDAAQTFAQEDKEARFGIRGAIGYVAGGLAAFGADPVNALTMAIPAAKAPQGVGVLARVGGAAGREAVLQGGIEAAQEVRGQAAQRERLGLDGSLKSSVQRVATAGLFGGTLRATSETIGAGAARLLGKEAEDVFPVEPLPPKEAPVAREVDALERAKHTELAKVIDPILARSTRGAASVLEDLERVRVAADDWSGPPLWSQDLMTSAAKMPDARGFSIQGETDLNILARQADPDTFRVYDQLLDRAEQLRSALDEARSPGAVVDDFAKKIQEANDKVVELTNAMGNRKLKPKEREVLVREREQAMATRDSLAATSRDGDTESAASIRKELQETDYALRDLAPALHRAYARGKGTMLESKKLNEAVGSLVKNRGAALDENQLRSIVDDAEKSYKTGFMPEDYMVARMGGAAPEPGETFADAVIRVSKAEGDAIEEQFDGFVASAVRALDSEEGGFLTIGTTKMSLDDTVYLPSADGEGFTKTTVREMLEDMRHADENQKALSSCLI